MPRLLQINVTSNFGSTGKITEQISNLAKMSGWESYVAYSRTSIDSKANLIKIGSIFSLILHVIQARLFDRAGLGSSIATKRLIKRIDEINPDVIHLHNIHGYVLNYKILFTYLNKRNIPIVWTFHDFWAITGHCAYFYDCCKWMSSCGQCKRHKDYPFSIIDNSEYNLQLKRDIFANANINIVTVSKWMSDYISQSILKDKKVSIIPNGVNVNLFKYTSGSIENGIVESDFVIIGVAIKWDERKGLQDYIKLSRLLRNNEKIILVGLTERQILGLPGNVIGLRRTETQSDLAKLYSRANVVLSLSYAETFGLTIVESFACGTPVIAYDNTAQSDLITEETGIKIKTGDVQGVRDAINIIKSKGQEYYEKSCRTRAEKYFDKEMCFKKYIELYESLLRK